MKQVLPHIDIGFHESGRVLLVIGDYDLFDFIDDYLTEKCDLLYESRSSAERVGGEVITMYFPAGVDAAEVEKCLSKLSPEEIEEIYQLNNR